jgi:prepilin-type N-terminal cleavage/methylation domain-containing protein
MSRPRLFRLVGGFTLIELLVVVSLLGILSGVMFAVINPEVLQNRAKQGRAEAEMQQFVEAVMIVREITGEPLGELTGNWCSMCPCRDASEAGHDLDSLDEDHACYLRWEATLRSLEQRSGGVVNLAGLERDPWGSPYLLDENEMEYAEGYLSGPCRSDWFRSAGPDKRIYGGDDISITVPFSSSQCVDTP